MKISWLFEIDETYYWSTKAVTFDSTNYTAKVLPESFNGIQMRWDVSRRGLITPSDLSFEIENTDGALSRSGLEGEYCTIILVTDGTESRRWKFYIKSATVYYGKILLDCIDILQEHLTGEYPNTLHPREAFPSSMHEVGEDDTTRVPIIFGTAYIPVMAVYKSNMSRIVTLTSLDPDLTLPMDDSVVAYCGSFDSEFIMGNGSKLELVNNAGNTDITVNTKFSLCAINRSGSVVSFDSYDGTFLKIPNITDYSGVYIFQFCNNRTF